MRFDHIVDDKFDDNHTDYMARRPQLEEALNKSIADMRAAYELELLSFPLAPGVMREWEIFFPLYGGIAEFALGLDPDARIEAPTPWRDPRPLVVYGTSVTQGGCASRPGMSPTNLLSRRWNVPVLNFGF